MDRAFAGWVAVALTALSGVACSAEDPADSRGGHGGENGNPSSGGEAGTGGGSATGGSGGEDPEPLPGMWPTYDEARQNPMSQELLLVIVDFADTNMDNRVPDAEAAWAGLMFGTDEGQINHYWYHATLGQFQLLPAAENHGTANDGVVRVKLSTPQPTDGTYLIEDQTWLREALDQLVGDVDFASFDTNGNALIQNDELAVLFAFDLETGRIDGAPAQANIDFNYPISGTGVSLEKFARVQWHHAAIGVPSHELGHHIFDLNHAPPPTEHDLMGQGAYAIHPTLGGLYDPNNVSSMRPTMLHGANKVAAGIVSPTEVTETTMGLELHAPSQGPDHNVIQIPVQGGYMFLENRTAWAFDESIPFCDGDTGGLFVMDVAQYMRSLNPAQISTLAEATNIIVENNEVCDIYSVPGKNDTFSFGGWTVTNLSEPGQVMTLDLIKEDVASVIDHYSISFFEANGDNRLMRLDSSTPIEVDYSTLRSGDSVDGYVAVALDAHYTTGEVRSVNLDSSWSSSNAYFSFVKGSTFTNPGTFMENQWVLADFDTLQTPTASAVITVSHEGFSAEIAVTNLPQP